MGERRGSQAQYRHTDCFREGFERVLTECPDRAFHSDLFRQAILAHENSETATREFQMSKEIDPNNVTPLVLDYMYTGRILLTLGNAVQLWKVADFLQMSGLMSLVEQFVEETVSMTNAWEVWTDCISLRVEQFKSKAISHIVNNFTFTKAQDYSGIPEEAFLALLIHERLTALRKFVLTSKYIADNPSPSDYFLHRVEEILESAIPSVTMKFLYHVSAKEVMLVPTQLLAKLLLQDDLEVDQEYVVYEFVMDLLHIRGVQGMAELRKDAKSWPSVSAYARLETENCGRSKPLDEQEAQNLLKVVRFSQLYKRELFEAHQNPLIPRDLLLAHSLRRLDTFEFGSCCCLANHESDIIFAPRASYDGPHISSISVLLSQCSGVDIKQFRICLEMTEAISLSKWEKVQAAYGPVDIPVSLIQGSQWIEFKMKKPFKWRKRMNLVVEMARLNCSMTCDLGSLFCFHKDGAHSVEGTSDDVQGENTTYPKPTNRCPNYLPALRLFTVEGDEYQIRRLATYSVCRGPFNGQCTSSWMQSLYRWGDFYLVD
ncbi:uncharacterized protein LOC134195854 [Corticium candelabrum]|uniref:uncharacterized protein LOC134195854 n=1 Tax=Corticium candelabrum TaxID=121492 RepID=UPI002E25FB3F|nr:uncharacterized protein LOC134195854 [Corticium candelabrum]